MSEKTFVQEKWTEIQVFCQNYNLSQDETANRLSVFQNYNKDKWNTEGSWMMWMKTNFFTPQQHSFSKREQIKKILKAVENCIV